MEMTTPAATPCKDCGTTGGSLGGNAARPRRTQGYCVSCYQRHIRNRDIALGPAVGGWSQEPHPDIPTGLVTPTMIGIRPGQPPTDPGLTPRKVWEIAHLNARKAIQWLVNTGRMTPDEAAALVMLSYAPPSDAARVAA